MAHLEPIRTPRTIYTYGRTIKTHIDPVLGTVRLARLTPKHIDDYLRAPSTRGVKAGTVRRHFAIINACLNQALKWGWIRSQPSSPSQSPEAAQPKRPKVPPRTNSHASTQKRSPRRAAPKGSVLAAAIGVAAFFGAPAGRSCRSVGMTSTSTQQIWAFIAAARSWEGSPMRVTPSHTKSRSLAMDENAMRMLRARQEYQRQLAEQAGTELVANPYLFSMHADGARTVQPRHHLALVGSPVRQALAVPRPSPLPGHIPRGPRREPEDDPKATRACEYSDDRDVCPRRRGP